MMKFGYVIFGSLIAAGLAFANFTGWVVTDFGYYSRPKGPPQKSHGSPAYRFGRIYHK
jgi:hypothetical protein